MYLGCRSALGLAAELACSDTTPTCFLDQSDGSLVLKSGHGAYMDNVCLIIGE